MTATAIDTQKSAGRRIPQTFECRPTPPRLPQGALPDELMIDWGGVPEGSKAWLYLPATSAVQTAATAASLYGVERLIASDSHTVALVTGAVSYVPLPLGSDGNFAGLLTLELPSSLPHGARCDVIVRQISAIVPARLGDEQRRFGRKVIGGFHLSVKIEAAKNLLEPIARSLAFFRWILTTLDVENRWYPVVNRYVNETALRLEGLGGNAKLIAASSIGALPGEHASGHDGAGHAGNEMTWKGKIVDLIYDRFGDFEGFVLETDSGSHATFRSREREVARLVRWAWRARLRVTVFARESKPDVAERILLHARTDSWEAPE